jgi:protein-S-isoprenylcysteine O-methyltransferase Ste14
MLTVLRHLVAVVALPFAVTVVIPFVIARHSATSLRWPATASHVAVWAVGLILLAVGVALFLTSVFEFAFRGRGTLAPWDPPRALVIHGPYRFVRNPMISGVVFILVAETALLLSTAHAIWAVVFAIINMIYIPLIEEPQLEHRFGDAYREYCRHVPRLFPTVRPWEGPR